MDDFVFLEVVGCEGKVFGYGDRVVVKVESRDECGVFGEVVLGVVEGWFDGGLVDVFFVVFSVDNRCFLGRVKYYVVYCDVFCFDDGMSIVFVEVVEEGVC